MESCPECHKQIELYQFDCGHKFCFACLEKTYKAGVFYCYNCGSQARNFPRVAAEPKESNYIKEDRADNAAVRAPQAFFSRPVTPTPPNNKFYAPHESGLCKERLEATASHGSTVLEPIIISLRYEHPDPEQQCEGSFVVQIQAEHRRKRDFLNLVLQCTEKSCKTNITILIGNSQTTALPFTHCFSHTFAKQMLSIPVGPTEYLLSTFGSVFDISVQFSVLSSDELLVQDLKVVKQVAPVHKTQTANPPSDQARLAYNTAENKEMPKEWQQSKPKQENAGTVETTSLPEEKPDCNANTAKTKAEKAVSNYLDELPNFVLDVTNPKGFEDIIQLYNAEKSEESAKQSDREKVAQKDNERQIGELTAKIGAQESIIESQKLYIKQLQERLKDAEEQTGNAVRYGLLVQQEKQQILKYEAALQRVFEATQISINENTPIDYEQQQLRLLEPTALEIEVMPLFFNATRESAATKLKLADFRYFTIFRSPAYPRFEGGRFDANVLARSAVARELFITCAKNGSIEGVF